MRVQRYFFLLAVLAFVFCFSEGVALAILKMPAWPQAFSIGKDETFSISVPVTQPGTITVSLTWQGGPLMAAIKDQKGAQLMTPAVLPGTSMKADYVIKPTDLRRGVLWTLTLSSPQNVPITGQITMAYPAVDMAKANAAVSSLLPIESKPNNTKMAAFNLHARQAFELKRNDFLRARQVKLDSMNAVTRSYTSSTTSSTRQSKFSVGSSGSSIAGTRITKPVSSLAPVLSNIDISKLTYAPAQLNSVSPTKGKPYAIVVLTGANLLPDKFFTTANASIATYWDGAMFTVAPNNQKVGKLSNARKNADGTISIDAQVPAATGLVDEYNGNVCLYSTGNKTNTVSFKYQPSGLPTITSWEPNLLGPNDDLVLHGIFFSRDDKAYIDMGNGDVEVPISYWSDKQVSVTIPNYTSKTQNTRRFYIVHQYSYGWDGGAPIWVPTRPTEATITSVSYVSGTTMVSTNPQGQPGDPIVIQGEGFSNPKVHFIIANGMDKVADIQFSDGNTIRTSVPDVTGVANDYAGSVYVMCDGNRKSNLVGFTFHPTKDYQMIDLYKFRPDGYGNISFSEKAMSNYYMMIPDTDPNNPKNYIANILAGHHTGELLWGFKDDDIYFQTKRLKNNWKVSYIDLTHEDGGSRLDGSSYGTDSPYAKVHWWVDLCSFCDYYLTWHVEGPKGTTYY